jgi:RNA polymerase sigma factor (sigma-70 family)
MTSSDPQPQDRLPTGDLVLQARAGDARARHEIVLRFSRPLAQLFHRRLPRGISDTEDIVQETLAAALSQLDSFEYRGVGSFWNYLRRIGLNRIAQERRDLRPAAGEIDVHDSRDAPSDHDANPLSALLDREQAQQLEAAIARVAQPHRDALLLWLELDLGYEAIASECGYPSRDAARMAICRAIEALSSHLAREGFRR